MRLGTFSVVGAIVASAGLASAALGASTNYPLGNLTVGDIPGNVYETTLAAPGFNPTHAAFSTDWSANFGDPYSSEAIWAITDSPLVSATEFYFDLGPAPDSFDDGFPASLNWSGYRGGYDPLPDLSASALNFIAGQAFSGSSAFWDNSSLTLSDDVAPAPISFIDLGTVANAFEPFSIDTYGSDFDTELGFFNHAGGLADTNDDEVGLQSELMVPGLPAGDYFFNAGGFNTIYGNGGFQVDVDSFGSDGGNLIINISSLALPTRAVAYSGELAPDSNVFFRITVVPTPGTLGLVSIAGLAGLRRRR